MVQRDPELCNNLRFDKVFISLKSVKMYIYSNYVSFCIPPKHDDILQKVSMAPAVEVAQG